MRATGWGAVGFAALTLLVGGAPASSGFFGLPAAEAQENGPTPSLAVPKSGTEPAGAVRKPHVRTYSSVTVVDDPKRVPPLPTRRHVDGTVPERREQLHPPAAPEQKLPAEPRPTAEQRPPAAPLTSPTPAPTPPANPAAPAAPAKSDVTELRRELHELRQTLREPRGSDSSAASERAKRRQEADSARAADRATHERGRSARD